MAARASTSTVSITATQATQASQAARLRRARERDLRAESSFAHAVTALHDIQEKCASIDAHLEESDDGVVLRAVEVGDEDSLVVEIDGLQQQLRAIPG